MAAEISHNIKANLLSFRQITKFAFEHVGQTALIEPDKEEQKKKN